MAVNFALRDAMAMSAPGKSKETAAAQQAVAAELQLKWDASQQQAADVLTELQRSQHAMAQQMAAMQVEIDNKDQAALHQAEAAQEELHLTFQEVAAQVKALQLEMERRDKVTQRVARASQAEQARSNQASAAHHKLVRAEIDLHTAAVQQHDAAILSEQRRTSNVLHFFASQASLAPLVPLALVALSPPMHMPCSTSFAAQLFLRNTSKDEAAASASAFTTLQASELIHSVYAGMEEDQSSPMRPVVRVLSDDLDAFAERVNAIITPTTFDLGGRELHHMGQAGGVGQGWAAGQGPALGDGGHSSECSSVGSGATGSVSLGENQTSGSRSAGGGGGGGGSSSSAASSSERGSIRSIDILRSGVTLRNGTIVLSNGPMGRGPSLRFSGRGVELERITVCGGSVGVLVQPGGGATLRGCEIRGAYAGLSVGSYEDITAVASVLVAHEVKVYGCSEVGLVVGGRGSAVLSDCEFSNGKEHGMGVWGDRDSRLAVTRVQCVRNGGYGLCVLNGGHAALCGTVLRGNERGSVHVVGEGSRAELWGCTLDRVATTEAGGEVALRE
ncbi:MAG: hypothetical protein WDW36_004337 [Sanguina aurantia]